MAIPTIPKPKTFAFPALSAAKREEMQMAIKRTVHPQKKSLGISIRRGAAIGIPLDEFQLIGGKTHGGKSARKDRYQSPKRTIEKIFRQAGTGSSQMPKAPAKNGFLNMQPVFRFVEHNGLRAVHDFRCNFFFAVSRKAVHK